VIEEVDQTFKGYLGEHEKVIYDIRQCPISRMSLCVTSDAEYDKCVKMKVS
jgi:melanoma-associated antigen p97